MQQRYIYSFSDSVKICVASLLVKHYTQIPFMLKLKYWVGHIKIHNDARALHIVWPLSALSLGDKEITGI